MLADLHGADTGNEGFLFQSIHRTPVAVLQISARTANEPPLLLADEPTGNLDTAASVEIMELFSQLHKEGTTVVVVTHEEEIAAFTERIIRFRDGGGCQRPAQCAKGAGAI